MNIRKIINLVKIGKSVLLYHLFRIKTPINVMWRITNRCNSKCSYCHIYNRKQKELKTSQILKIIDDMKKCGVQRIGFVGGEALLRDDFEKIIDHVKNKNIYVTLVTNGTLIKDHIDIIKKLDYVVISFDGKLKNHDKGRKKGSYYKVIETFDICRDNNIKVMTNTVLNKYNINDIDFILDTVKEYGFNATFNLLQGDSDSYPSHCDYVKSLNYLIKKKKEGYPIILSFKTLEFLKKWKDHKKFMSYDKIKRFRCYAGKLIYNIDTDGKIAACDIMSNIKKDNPNVLDLGFKKAYRKVKNYGCKACTCAHVIEYNHMFSFDLKTIYQWGKMIFRK